METAHCLLSQSRPCLPWGSRDIGVGTKPIWAWRLVSIGSVVQVFTRGPIWSDCTITISVKHFVDHLGSGFTYHLLLPHRDIDKASGDQSMISAS